MSTPPLWSHQQRAIDDARQKLMSERGSLLWLPMRAGKCRVTLELIQEFVPADENAKVLILASRDIIGDTWLTEVALWAYDWRYVALDTGTTAKRKERLLEAYHEGGPLIVGINYEAAINPSIVRVFERLRWSVVVYDECHRLQTPNSKTSRLASRISRLSGFRFGLTGTPISGSRRQLGIWAQYRAIARHIFHKKYTDFQDHYTAPEKWGRHDIVVVGRDKAKYPLKLIWMDEYMERFMRVATQVLPSEIEGTPDVSDVIRETELTGKAMATYRELERENFVRLRGEQTVTTKNVFDRILRLQQIANGWVRDDTRDRVRLVQVSRNKERLLSEVLMELDEPVVVVCVFKSDLEVVRTAAGKRGVPYYELSGRHRDLAKWRECAAHASVLGAQIQSAKEGIDLTKARVVIWYSLGNNLANYQQMRARVEGKKQQGSVTHITLKVAKTIDEDMIGLMVRKQSNVRQFASMVAERYGLEVVETIEDDDEPGVERASQFDDRWELGPDGMPVRQGLLV